MNLKLNSKGAVMSKQYNEMSVGEGLITALEQAIEFEKGKRTKGTKITKVSIAPLPHYTAKSIKKIRNDLGLSQLTFAHVMGVSIKTIEAWESGRNEPQGPAQRMLMILEKDNHFLEKYGIVLSV